MGQRPLLRERAPAFAAELEEALRAEGKPELADQVDGLRIAALCSCEVAGCASFSTVMPMKRWFRRGALVPVGEVVVNTIDGEIAFVEVLDRPDVRAALRAD
jgi:hypothetical protein